MLKSHELETARQALLGEGPIRAIPLQTDAERAAIVAETGGAPIMDVAEYSTEGSTPFIDYINADFLHTLQQPRSDGRDELTFICMAQVMELQFKLMSGEMLRAQDALRRDALAEVMPALRRGHRILAYLGNIWDVLGTITPQGYLEFRDHLGIGSGFESFMYRRLEFLLGNKQPTMLKPHRHVPKVHAMLEEALRMPSLYDDVVAFLSRQGLAIDAAALNRDYTLPYQSNASVRAAWLSVYKERDREDQLFDLAEALIELGDRFKVWRYRHFVSVERLIGFKPGTGGTAGVGWLRQIVDHNFFPELWELRTEL
ncbi:tryptophan 2,3-dioxygenase family protein [Sphingomonas sp.]|uniref:tryptophan 2,3-dioxygenase n=1 Tax=Sphingomonas sp. TaxID=28214 RepID=UPI000DB30583|nr:tryptophan 2,3-dioxygenase family protein [Sphingomonas sp.]PZU10762.1 MAG: tryptophan 2,3-dioxygenase [Sphingomonas sp.]